MLFLTSHIVPGISSTWPKSTWRNTMYGTGLEWFLLTKIEVFMNWGTSTLPRMKERKKINCALFSLFILEPCQNPFLMLDYFLPSIAWDMFFALVAILQFCSFKSCGTTFVGMEIEFTCYTVKYCLRYNSIVVTFPGYLLLWVQW